MWLFILMQGVLLAVITLHDWIRIPPFNNLDELNKVDTFTYKLVGSCINGAFVVVPLVLTVVYQGKNHLANLTTSFFYGGLTLGTILSWWTPYFLGSSPRHKQAFQKFQKTYHCLPPIKDHVVPNTLHIALHLLVWGCFGYSLAMI